MLYVNGIDVHTRALELAIHQVADVVAVLHRGVPAAKAVAMNSFKDSGGRKQRRRGVLALVVAVRVLHFDYRFECARARPPDRR